MASAEAGEPPRHEFRSAGARIARRSLAVSIQAELAARIGAGADPMRAVSLGESWTLAEVANRNIWKRPIGRDNCSQERDKQSQTQHGPLCAGSEAKMAVTGL